MLWTLAVVISSILASSYGANDTFNTAEIVNTTINSTQIDSLSQAQSVFDSKINKNENQGNSFTKSISTGTQLHSSTHDAKLSSTIPTTHSSATLNEATNKPEETTTEEELGFISIIDFESDSETTSTTPVLETTVDIKTRREKLSDQIRAVIKHYKEFGKVTIPHASVPDPMEIPNIRKSFSGNDVTFNNTKVYGLSNFTIEHVNTDLDKMQVYVAIYIRQLIILGNYSTSFLFKKVAGPFNVTLLYVQASGAAALVRDEHGNLQASESEMDMTFMDSKVKFGNMGLMGTLLQGVVASAGPILFEAIKPIVLTEINNKLREDINKKIKSIGTKFNETGSEHPIDRAIKEGKIYVRENGYDPYVIDNYVLKYMPRNQTLFNVNISRLTLTGLSNFRRVGDVSISMDSGTIQMGIHLATSKLRGKCTWKLSVGHLQRIGHTNFIVDYVQVRGIVNQSLDVSQHPVLEDLDINVGKVRVQIRGTSPFDMILEAAVNTLPDLIRHIVVDTIEIPLKYAVQNILSDINVEDVLEKQLPELDKIGL